MSQTRQDTPRRLVQIAPRLSVLALAFACASPSGSDETSSTESTVSAHTPGVREPFTTTFEVWVEDRHEGYLLRYDALPEFSEIERTLPTGTQRILDLDFQDIGFVTGNGEFVRYGEHGTENHGAHDDLLEGLSRFYGERKPVRVRTLQAAEAAKEDDAIS